MITDAAYEELKEAVGAGNASREPAVLDGYAWQPFVNDNPGKWVTRPVAVVLPGTTEEVQEVVRACNRHGLKFKAFSTGWGVFCGPTSDDVVQVDLRRMGRILEIDEKNMYAVVEPYVCGAQLQAEVMKLGLNTHIIGAGPSCSLLAGATSMHGMGWDGIYMGHSSRNVMGVEWVLPDGEVLRMGSRGSGLGWFSADGPGPSLRGIMRGVSGACGGLGVFTKCALKLFNWPGPPVVETEGTVLNASSRTPEHFEIYMCLFRDRNGLADATYEIGEAEIGYNNVRLAMGTLLSCLAPHAMKKVKRADSMRAVLGGTFKYPLIMVLKTGSAPAMAHEVKTLRAIVSDYGGIAIDLGKIGPLASLLTMNLLRTTAVPLVFRVGGLFGAALSKDESWDSQLALSESLQARKQGWIDEGGMIDDMVVNPFLLVNENNMWSHCEEVFLYDGRDSKHVESFGPINFDFITVLVERCMEPLMGVTPPLRKLLSPMLGDYRRWQKGISAAIDRGNAADTGLYCDDTEMDFSGLPEEMVDRIDRLASKLTWTEMGPPSQGRAVERCDFTPVSKPGIRGDDRPQG